MKKNDLKLILALALLAGAALLWQKAGGMRGQEAVIYKNGEEYARISLSEDNRFPIGESNVLVIEEGKARMQEADCPDQICVRHLPVSHAGESIVCLPNRVVVEIQGTSEVQDVPDAVAY